MAGSPSQWSERKAITTDAGSPAMSESFITQINADRITKTMAQSLL
jgi:hypothetical protein